MTALINTVTSLVNAVFVGGSGEGASGSWVGSVVSAITASGNEILLVGFILSIAGFGVGIVKRLTRLG